MSKECELCVTKTNTQIIPCSTVHNRQTGRSQTESKLNKIVICLFFKNFF